MTLLRGDALRSGRNTTKCASRPISAAMANEIAIAGSVPRGSLSLMVIRTGRLLSRMARSQPHSGMMSTHGRKISPAPLTANRCSQGGESASRVHGDRTLGEVDDTRAAIRDDETGRQDCVDRPPCQHRVEGQRESCSLGLEGVARRPRCLLAGSHREDTWHNREAGQRLDSVGPATQRGIVQP